LENELFVKLLFGNTFPDPLAFATRLYNKLPALKRSFKFELGIAFSGVLGMALKS